MLPVLFPPSPPPPPPKTKQDMIALLSQGLAARLTHFVTQVKAQQQEQYEQDAGLDIDLAEEVLRGALKAELDRLVQVPFGVPLLHEIG